MSYLHRLRQERLEMLHERGFPPADQERPAKEIGLTLPQYVKWREAKLQLIEAQWAQIKGGDDK